MNKYLASDLDGTLLNPKEKYIYVCKENKDAISKFANNVILVSGRNVKFVSEVCQELNIDKTFIACNGASIFCKGKEIFTSFVPNSLIIEIIEYVQKTFKEYCIILFNKDSSFYSISEDPNRVNANEQEYISKYPKLGYTTNKNVDEINKLLSNEDTFIKVNVALNDEDKQTLFDYLKDNNYPLSYAICKRSVEISALGINKGEALSKLTKYMNIDKNDVYVIGDDNNDISMFNSFANSFLVSSKSNAHIEKMVSHVLPTFKEITKYIKEE